MFSSVFTLLSLICSAHCTTLLRGGTFITYSDSTSNLEIITEGAMLFNDTIIAISPTIDGLDSQSNSDVQVVNTTGKIISPGFVDTHRHTWLALILFLETVLNSTQANCDADAGTKCPVGKLFLAVCPLIIKFCVLLTTLCPQIWDNWPSSAYFLPG